MPAVAVAVKKPVKAAKRHPWSREKYGTFWLPMTDPTTGKAIGPMPDWKIEAWMYLNAPRPALKARHFMRMISIIFASPLSKRPFVWNPNSVRICEAYFKYNYLGIAGHASSSKSETCAIIALGEFLADPANTAVLVTSTTIPDARQRIWARIEFYWQDCCDYFAALGAQMGCKLSPPGTLISSSAMIRYQLEDRKETDRGIKLVPGKESEVKEGIGRMKGFKAKRMRFLADELSDLSHKLLEAAESNLFVNEDFKMVGCFNPSSHFDPAGVFSEPEGGWASVNVLESDGWNTKRGYCIRFDGQSSPNVVAGYKIWDGLLTRDKLDELRKNLGDNSPGFMSMCRGAWSETGNKDGIYTEAEIINALGMQKVTVWEGPKTVVGGFDPSFVHGGDRAALVLGITGKGLCNGKFKQCIEVTKILFLDENIDTKQDKKEQILQRLKDACKSEGLDPSNLAMDATGGGDVFVTLMNRDQFFARKFIPLGFGEQASEIMFQGKAGKDKFSDRMSELWYVGRPLLHGGQIKGLKPDIIREMTLRLYETQGGSKKRIKVEPKDVMKRRMNGRSPDCFVAGTMVATPIGEIPIESLHEGDEVLTPFGASRIFKVHRTFATETTKIGMSNGRTLEGKGAHRVFSDGEWRRLDDLCLTNTLESVTSRLLWLILNSCFTRVENSGFKHLVDTTKRIVTRRARRDFFTESSGATNMGLFLKACASIIRMAIGETIGSQILRPWTFLNMRAITPCKTWLIQKFAKRFWLDWTRLELQQCIGTPLQRGSLGTLNMARDHGITEASPSLVSAFIAQRNSRVTKQEPSIVLQDAGKLPISTSKSVWNIRALFAGLNSLVTSIVSRRVAVESAEGRSWQQPVSVFNLTLAEENAYYANGVLVENCSDAFFLMIHVCRAKHGLRADGMVAPTKPRLDPHNPLAGAFDWGLKKKPRLNEPDLYDAKGGGWADNEGAGFGSMFG